MARRVSTAQLAPKRRSATYKDSVGEKLFECSTIAQMVKLAKSVDGLNTDKLAGVEARAAAGLQLGLVRMQIGNLIRGAERRAAKAEGKPKRRRKAAGTRSGGRTRKN